jgi:hypothetical protein
MIQMVKAMAYRMGIPMDPFIIKITRMLHWYTYMMLVYRKARHVKMLMKIWQISSPLI